MLYVQDVHTAQGRRYGRAFSSRTCPILQIRRITLAHEGILVPEGRDRLHLHLIDGATHETDPKLADHYQISTFQQTGHSDKISFHRKQSGRADSGRPGEHIGAARLCGARRSGISARWYLIEFHRRFALPTAWLVLAMVGNPLGLSSKKRGKSGGFCSAPFALVLVYYFVSLIGMLVSAPREHSADVRSVAGEHRLSSPRVRFCCGRLSGDRSRFQRSGCGANATLTLPMATYPHSDSDARQRQMLSNASIDAAAVQRQLPTLIDDYVLRDFFVYLEMILSSIPGLAAGVHVLSSCSAIFCATRTPFTVVAEYLLNVAPYLLYSVAPLIMLLAVLITFGLMNRSNEITAIKATGTSIYRIVAPVIVAAAVLAVGLFFADQFYLPHTNKRQEALHNQIKGKPAQTYLRPDRKWIFGQHNDIYYYQFFDPDHDQFANVTIFQIDPASFSISERIHADRAHWADSMNRWIFEQGWERSLHGSAIAGYRTFEVSTFPELSESPSYFKKEVKQYSEMNYEELHRYIRDLQQSGFDVVRLRVQLNKKLSFPLITLIMAVLAVPFSLSAAKKGAITGVAVAVGIAVVYTVVSRLFEAMGDLSQLPPALAAWSPDLIFALVGSYLILKIPT